MGKSSTVWSRGALGLYGGVRGGFRVEICICFSLADVELDGGVMCGGFQISEILSSIPAIVVWY